MKNHVRVVFDRKKVASVTGTGKIELSVYLQAGERKWITVGMAAPDKWEAVAEQSAITAKVKHYEEVIKAMKMLDEELTIENFEKHVMRSESTVIGSGCMYNGHDLRQSFVEFCRASIEKEDLRPNSMKGFRVVFDSLEASGILKTLADLTPANVNAYDAWLHRQNNKTDYTIFGYHKKVHKYTRQLWRMGMISSDPYEHVKFNRGSNKERTPLSEDDITTMREAKYTGRLDRVRDLFIFMAYTGLAYCDMKLFDFDTMVEKRPDYYYIDGSRMKTGSKFYTPILPPAMAVLEKYNFKLPVISNQKINDYCHLIQADLKINKEITCHVARHSFATLMLSYGIPIESVKRMLGHKNITTTQLYAKILKKNVEQSVSQMLQNLR